MGWLDNTRTPWRPGPLPAGRPLPDGWSRVLLPIESIEHGTRRVLGWGLEAQVLGPAPLRRAVVQALAAMQARYAA